MKTRGRLGSFRRFRELYREKWGRDWPHGEEYLRELKGEAETEEELLRLMRENHEFGEGEEEGDEEED